MKISQEQLKQSEKLLQEIVAKAWEDDSFKESLIAQLMCGDVIARKVKGLN